MYIDSKPIDKKTILLIADYHMNSQSMLLINSDRDGHIII